MSKSLFSCKMVEVVTDIDTICEEKIKEELARSCIEKWLYVIHDKDETRPHYHIYLKFTHSQKSLYIAQWFGVAENFLQKIKGQFSDAVKYSIHRNRPDKHQYSTDIIKSNFDYNPYLVVEKEDTSEYDVFIQKILDGEIRAYNKGKIPNAMYINKDWNRKIKLAFEKREENIKNENLERGEKFMVLYIKGQSGKGKSVFAKEWAKKQGYSYYKSSMSNDPLDGYEGQDVLILDDIRYDTFKANDLYKLLDTTSNTSVKSRYKNKSLYECKVIIITCVHDWKTWYAYMDDEPKQQFERRISMVIEVNDIYMRMAENINQKIQPFGKWIYNPFAPSVLYKDVKKNCDDFKKSLELLVDDIPEEIYKDIEKMNKEKEFEEISQIELEIFK